MTHAPTSRAIVLVIALASCDDLDGFGGDAPPLAEFAFEVTGDFEAVRVPDSDPARLRVSLVWGAQWLSEAMCFLPPESSEVAAVVAAGCRDPFGFVPDRGSTSVEAAPNASGSLPLFALPSADVMVGTVTGRMAYASLVVFEDRDDDGLLDFSRVQTPPDDDDHGPGSEEPDPMEVRDRVYGSSFVSMTEPDVRIALREGSFDPNAAFYPRAGCGEPLVGFSILSAGGFTRDAALAAALGGQLPAQDPASCAERAVNDAVVQIPLRPPAEVSEIGCVARRADSSVRYREPPVEMPDFTDRVTACASVPDFGSGEAEGLVQLLVSSASTEPCKGLTHYVLRGCREDAACEVPDWDLQGTPPAWWPCPLQAKR